MEQCTTNRNCTMYSEKNFNDYIKLKKKQIQMEKRLEKIENIHNNPWIKAIGEGLFTTNIAVGMTLPALIANNISGQDLIATLLAGGIGTTTGLMSGMFSLYLYLKLIDKIQDKGALSTQTKLEMIKNKYDNLENERI